ncbi:hypothetical protein [Fusobacterium perfoetens]|uniref:hypothetical protein n=1 Tax=Fusobacterium perfoetens TaxID=852 RepID=UPI000485DE5A|nr:hypothetical protein [Fusobacterium perfoetens]MCI6152234.1 hypothetical protein [Fusobacterium perfoetens]MDY3237494.1 hypothetical protein [Fusobacterium perfoetens]
MDTIEIAIKLNNTFTNINEINTLIYNIENIKSNYGYNFCNVLELSRTGNLIVKISYPRFYKGTNAFLITRRSECFEVQRYLVYNLLREYEVNGIIQGIVLNRVDIPFTYLMNIDECFTGYQNIFYILANVYNKKLSGISTKGYINLLEREMEIVIYSPNKNNCSGKNYNSRLEIYNQYLNLESKLPTELFEEITKTYSDLPQRIRMEVSKRIRLRRTFNTFEFENLDILGNYFENYKKYILDNFLDFKEIERLYSLRANELANWLMERRKQGKINYTEFIYQNQGLILDYEVVRRALGLAIDNVNTRENAITKVRKILFEYENLNNVIIVDTYKILKNIYNTISTTILLD